MGGGVTRGTPTRAQAGAGRRNGAGGGATPPDAQRGAQGAASLTLTLPLPSPLLTINATSSMHWAQKGRHVKAQRAMAAWHARLQLGPDWVPLVGRVRLDVTIRPRPRQKEPDAGGKWQAIKPLEDGLQDAGVFAGGDDRVVVYGAFTWDKTQRTGEIELTLTQEG